MNVFDKRIAFLYKLIHKLREDDIFASAAQLSYYIILAFFPFLIFVITLIGYLNLDSSEVINSLRALLPESVHTLIVSTVTQIIDVRNGDLLWLSILSVIIAASTGFRGVIKAINKSYCVKENRLYPVVWIISVLSTIALTTAIAISLCLLVFGEAIGSFLAYKIRFGEVFFTIWTNIRYIISIPLIMFFFAAIYKFAPAYKPRWKDVYIGSIVSTVSWIAVCSVFTKFVNNANKLTMLYGGLSAMFALILWIYLTSFVFILGMEINSVLFIKRKTKEISIK